LDNFVDIYVAIATNLILYGCIMHVDISYICDYLGSVHLVYDGKTGDVVQSLEYLPSGLIFRCTNYDFQLKRYTGKELLSTHGLN
jgi:hypothetical protein